MDDNQTENVRTSSRLKEKSQRRFTLPDRKEELDRLVPDDKTPFKDYNDYKPRKLINNFIKERNSYNNPDKIDLFDEFSDEDFLDDGSSSDDDSDTSSVPRRKGSAKPWSSSDSSTDDTESKASAGNPVSWKRSTRRSLSARLRLGREDQSRQSDSEEELARPLKMHKQRLLAGRSSGSEMSSGDDLSEPVLRKKRRGRPSVQSDGEEDDEIQTAASIPDLVRVDEDSEQSKTSMSKENKDPDLKEDNETPAEDNAEQPDSGNEQDSSSSFVATSDSSESDWSYYKGSSPNKPSHEELICNYRQKKRPRKQSRVVKKRRVLTPSESDSSSGEPDASVMEQQRPASKRAEGLLRKKTAWKAEVLGNYKEKREKKLAHKKLEKTPTTK